MQVIKTVCGMCGADHCGVEVAVDGGQVIDIRGMQEHPVNRGRLCPQARAAIEQTYDPKRIRTPLRRTEAGWEIISWDNALDIIARKLEAIRDEVGPEALAVYHGRAVLKFTASGWAHRFLNLYGTPNFLTNDHMCAVPTWAGEKLTFGDANVWGIEADMTNCVLLWGTQPSASFIPTLWRDLIDAGRRGAKLIVIDPRVTPAAGRADLHARPRPGTDTALALGLIHHIIKHDLVDAPFVSAWTVGFDALSEHVAEHTPEWAAAVTGVPADLIRQIAETYATTRPAALHIGNALEQSANGGQAMRALNILRAITGNLDAPGGDVLLPPMPRGDVRLSDRLPPDKRTLGLDRYPIFTGMAGLIAGDALLETLETGQPHPLKAMIMVGGNPLVTWPDADRVRRALRRLDLLVVMDLYLTRTAREADLVLPAANSLEKTQLIARAGHYGEGHPLWALTLKKKVVEPAGESRSEWSFYRALAERMGYGEHYPWEDEEAAIAAELEGTGVTLGDLKAAPGGLTWGDPPHYYGYRKTGFNTPSGKVELYSQQMADMGYDPLPVYVEPPESPVSTPALAEDYPLILTVGANIPVYTASRHRTLPSLRSKAPEPLCQIHPDTGADYGIGDGEMMIVETPRGQVSVKADVTGKVLPGMVALNHGWEEANGNLLTAHQPADPVFGSPAARALLCRIRPAAGASND